MSAPSRLNPSETRRYGRHLVLPEVGLEGQLRLKDARVLIVGAGGLGAPAALYLAAAGVGRLGIVDFDDVDASNLQRQVLYATADVGRKKVVAARERLAALNPEIEIETYPVRLSASNAREILTGYQVVVDGTDNFPTRYLVNDACVLLGLPYVYGTIFRFEGQASVFWKGRGPCYRCLHPEPPPPGMIPNCAEGGVLGVLPGVIGSIQATEALKIALGRSETLAGRLLLFDALTMRFREMTIARDPACPVCGDRPTITTLVDQDEACAVPDPEPAGPTLTVAELHARLARGAKPILLDVRTPQEWAICHLDGATLIPLQTLPARAAELPREAEIVCYCHVGARSAMAAAYLRREGYARARNLVGGIEAWAREIDPSMPRY
jgi:sulfur-carrier protein adenylyltransferase/sulfurtransferase